MAAKDLAERLRDYAATCTQKPCSACLLIHEAADALDRLGESDELLWVEKDENGVERVQRLTCKRCSEVESGSEGVTDDAKLDAAIYVESRRRALAPRFKGTMSGAVFSDYYERWREEMEGAYLAGRESGLAADG